MMLITLLREELETVSGHSPALDEEDFELIFEAVCKGDVDYNTFTFKFNVVNNLPTVRFWPIPKLKLVLSSEIFDKIKRKVYSYAKQICFYTRLASRGALEGALEGTLEGVYFYRISYHT